MGKSKFKSNDVYLTAKRIELNSSTDEGNHPSNNELTLKAKAIRFKSMNFYLA